MSKRNVFQISLIITLIIILLGVSGIIYLNKFYIPNNLTPLISKKIANLIDRKIEIQSVSYNLLTGFKIKRLKIFEKYPDDNKLFLEAKQIDFNIQLLPILKSKKIIIPEIHIFYPKINMQIDKNGKFNIPFPKKTKISTLKKEKLEKNKKHKTKKAQIIISRINVENGKMTFIDNSKSQIFKKNVEDINISTTLSLPGSINFEVNGSIINESGNNSASILSNGKYNLKTHSFSINANSNNMFIADYSSYFKKIPVSITGGEAKDLILIISGDKKNLDCKYDMTAENFTMAKNKYKLSGNFTSNGNIKINLSDKKKNEYNGVVNFKNGKLKGIPGIEPIQNIKGGINFSKNHIKTDSITSTISGYPAKIKGELTSFDSPEIDISFSGFNSLKADSKFKINGENISISEFKGEMFNSKLDFNAKLISSKKQLILKNCNGNLSLSLKDIKKITKRFGYNLKKIPELEGVFNGSFEGSGALPDIRNLNISISGNSNNISLKGFNFNDIFINYKQKKNHARVMLNSKGYNGKLKLVSNLKLDKKNINYQTNINIEDVNLAELKNDTKWKDKETAGKLNLVSSIKGNIKNLSNLTGNAQIEVIDGKLWKIGLLKGLGEILSLGTLEKFVFKNANGDFTIKNKKVYTENFKFISDNFQLIFIGKFDFQGNITFNVLTTFAEKFDQIGLKDIEKVISTIFTETQKIIGIKIMGTFKNPIYVITPHPERIFKGLVPFF